MADELKKQNMKTQTEELQNELEQKRLDAMKRAADAAVFFSINNPETSPWLRAEIEEYRKIIEKEE
jgi:hypothetical protein